MPHSTNLIIQNAGSMLQSMDSFSSDTISDIPSESTNSSIQMTDMQISRMIDEFAEDFAFRWKKSI